MIGPVVACLGESVKIYLWAVGWLCLGLFCLLFRFIFFLSTKLPQVLFFPLILSFAIFFGVVGEDVRKISWIKLDTICLQMENGGLGVKSLKEFNISLLGKWVWRLLDEREILWNVVLRAKYGEEAGRVRFGFPSGSVWWCTLNQIRLGVGFVDNRWMLDNIVRRVGNGQSTLFWVDPWLDNCPLERSYSRLYQLVDNKLVTVSEMCELGRGYGGEAWKWRRRLFAWEEGLVMECVERLSTGVLQVRTIDRWVWKLHETQCYIVKSALFYLTAINTNLNEEFNSFLWLKAVLLKVNIFIWRLFLNRLSTKDNLLRIGVIDATKLPCASLCEESENHNHLFFRCDVYGRLWALVTKWLGFEATFHGDTITHAHQFRGLGGFSKKLGVRLQLFGLPFFLLFGKIATEGFSTTSRIILRLLLKKLNFKRIGD